MHQRRLQDRQTLGLEWNTMATPLLVESDGEIPSIRIIIHFDPLSTPLSMLPFTSIADTPALYP